MSYTIGEVIFMKNYGDRIRKARKAAKCTQEGLANALGLNRATISKYESGIITPTIDQFKTIAKTLNVDVYSLVDFETASTMLFDEINSKEEIYGAYYWPLLDAFLKLNNDGRQEAVKRIEELAELPRYKQEITHGNDSEKNE